MSVAGVIIGKRVPEFELKDQSGKAKTLSSLLQAGPALIVFYPGDFTAVCTKQLCNYRDSIDSFKEFGVQIVGISSNNTENHAHFAKQYDFPFVLLSDPNKKVAKEYGCSSLFMFGGISRAVFIVGKNGNALYRYIEPTVLTRRKADELIEIIKDLKNKNLI